jgi:hypothetical protein
MTETSNRRRADRVRVAAIATMETKGTLNANDQAVCTVRNMSRTGIGVETGQPPIPGQTVVLRLALDEEVHELKTRTTRVQRRGKSNFYEVGLDWNVCTQSQLKFLDEVLAVIEEAPLPTE